MRKYFTAFAFLICLTIKVYPQNFRTLEYLRRISGIGTLAGEHNREPNSFPATWTDSIYSATGKYPAFWSGDFLYEANNIANRWTMIYEAKREWDKGAIVQLMFHTCPPIESEPCSWSGTGGVLSHLTDAQWDSLITDGTTLNSNWKSRLDGITPYLQYLKDNGVEVLFRPLHEMNQGSFWWGGRPGPTGTARLYQITHDYLESKGLTNLIWVWDLQDFSTLSSDLTSYDPGSKYWNILALDVYGSDGTMYTMQKYNLIVNKAGSKPIAIGECQVLPSSSILLQQSRWSFFMGWSELVFSNNSISQIKTLYNSPNVITLDKMPGWESYCAYSGTPYQIPGKIEAENFDECGEGISYYNPDTNTTSVKYRLGLGVDIDTSSGGGYAITGIHKGEWLNYAVTVDTPGIYTLGVRVSSLSSGKTFHIDMDSVNISGPISVPNTGGNQSWVTVSVTTPELTRGLKIMHIAMDADSFSIDYVKFGVSNKAPIVAITSPANRGTYTSPADIKITASASDDGSISKVDFYNGVTKLGESATSPYSYLWANVPKGNYVLSAIATDNTGLSTVSDTVNISVMNAETPYDTIPYPVPGRIEAENYDNGGEGVAYHDLTVGNLFNVYRHDDVDVGTCNDTTGGGYAIGYFQTGEWVQYTVNVTKTADYDIEFRAASAASLPEAAISLEVDGKDVTGTIPVNTGGVQKWASIIKSNVPLTEGIRIMRLNSVTQFPNINYINFQLSTQMGVNQTQNTIPKEYKVYQNYPNPYNPTTIIRYEIPKSGYVTIKIYDALGREVQILVNEEKNAGSYEARFDGSKLSSGIYYYTIRAGDFFQAKQMVLLK